MKKPGKRAQERAVRTVDRYVRQQFESFLRTAAMANKLFLKEVFTCFEGDAGEEDDFGLASAFESAITYEAAVVISWNEVSAMRKRIFELEDRCKRFAFIDEGRPAA
jgi:hypothetical protein